MVDSLIILFDQNEQAFISNGLGALPDAASCVVTEERNGEYEIEMEYPLTGRHFHDIQKGGFSMQNLILMTIHSHFESTRLQNRSMEL